MSNNRSADSVVHWVDKRLSLRAPQAESLAKLHQAIGVSDGLLTHERDMGEVLAVLREAFPTLSDFERDFPSLCFALATGVGKTRLMGAFVSYLHLAHGINNFFVLAPNLTIYNKLIADFTPNTPKYVFRGISEFAQQPPLIITGDNYEQSGAAVSDTPMGFIPDVRINIFNIAKINSEVRGGKEPRIKRMREVLGDSYFNHLAELDDLVLLMDESHRYRAQAGMRAINDLKPLFGLELTATPFVELGSGKTQAFKNVVMDYPLARALDDGFVKSPAVVTQKNFNPSQYNAMELERIKLEDGIRLHELTKVELITYAREYDKDVVKPFMLVIARDTTHAEQLKTLMESDTFYEGRYAGKVIQVDSSQTGAKEEEMIARLLAVESFDEPTEIVVHVNMLKEGWDVTNLYTIVPLRAANARTLVEQSIGRGLRLPYGARTGVEAVDRLNIIAHDKFQEIVDDANRADSPIRLQQLILDAPTADDNKVNVEVLSMVDTLLGGKTNAFDAIEMNGENTQKEHTSVFHNEQEREVARVTLDVVQAMETERNLVPNSQALTQPEVQKLIAERVAEQLKPKQASLLEGVVEEGVDVQAVVAKATQVFCAQTIDIPKIVVVPTGEVSSGFYPFALDVSNLRLQPAKREIVGQDLHTNEQFAMSAQTGFVEKRFEDYVVHALMDFEDVDYFTQADLLYELAGQMVAHLKSYLSDDEVRDVLSHDRRLIAQNIHTQMLAHFWEKATDYEAKVSRGFTTLKPSNITVSQHEGVRPYRETVTELGKIKQMAFGGFSKCLYPVQKFDSDTERRFAVLAERDALKWFKPVKGQFQIYYKRGIEQPEYVPDFVIELENEILMVETKARNEINNDEVQTKAKAAITWCEHATAYNAEHGAKPWRYVLVSHDEVSESKTINSFI